MSVKYLLCTHCRNVVEKGCMSVVSAFHVPEDVMVECIQSEVL